ncbi:MAG TPA: GNAT family N-acetyltransferase [Clostridia bacterium]|nr:GNAT family N-acetyltransferase [Clostridia bacterium]
MVVGRTGFKNIADDKGKIELGYGINPNFRSKRYMTETFKKMVNWGFRQHLQPIKTIIAKTNKENSSSQKVLQKVGFEYKRMSEDFLCWKLNNKANNF